MSEMLCISWVENSLGKLKVFVRYSIVKYYKKVFIVSHFYFEKTPYVAMMCTQADYPSNDSTLARPPACPHVVRRGVRGFMFHIFPVYTKYQNP